SDASQRRGRTTHGRISRGQQRFGESVAGSADRVRRRVRGHGLSVRAGRALHHRYHASCRCGLHRQVAGVPQPPHVLPSCGLGPNDSVSASTVYTSHRSPSGPVTHTLSWVAKQHVVPISSSVNTPSSVRRAISPCTVSLDSTSTPRWLRVPPWPGFSMRTSFSGGSATAKLA